MLRKVLSAVTSTAVAAGLASAGVMVAAAPASATVAPNPNLVGCGIPITLVMDASGSISGDEITAMRAASKAFLAGLEDTGSTARIVEFAQTSKQLISRRDVAGAGLTQLNTAIDSYKSGGLGTTTNWESPLWRTFDEPIPGNKGLVVFLTDGDPNTVGGVDGSGTSGATATAATNAAEVYANQLKTAGNRMLGVGIGLSNTGQQDRLKQVTGPNLVTSIPANATINDFDAVVTNNFDDLSAALKRVAVALCGGTVSVTKQTDTSGSFEPQGNWPFTMQVTPGEAPGDYTWLQPSGATGDTVSGTTATTTDPGPPPTTEGVVTFQYRPKDTTTRTVRITEDLTGDQANFTPRNPLGYRCSINGLNPPAEPVEGSLMRDGTKAYFEIELKSDESASCDVFNERNLAKLALVKQVEGGDATKADFKLSATGSPGDKDIVDRPGNDTSLATVYAGTEYTLSESGPPNYSQVGMWVCKDAQDQIVGSGNKVTLDRNAEVTCTVTNSRDLAELKLVKQVDGGTAVPDDWTLSAEAEAPLNDRNFSNSGGSGDFEKVYTNTLYTLGEDGPGNYSGLGWECVNENVDRAKASLEQDGNQIALGKGDRVTCTIVNKRNTAELKLVKQVEGKNNPNEWTLTATGPNGAPNVQNPGGSGDFTTVWSGSEYTLGESGPGGYSPSDWVCLPAGEDPVPSAVDGQVNSGDKVTLKRGEKVTCTIVNTRDLGSLTITKEFNPQSSGYSGTFDINYTCVDGADPVKNGTVALGAGQSQTITGLPTGTVCTVVEPALPPNPTGWTFNPPTYSPANGQATVTTKGQAVGVTVVNSVAQVSPVVSKKVCPITVTLVKPKPKKVGNRVLVKKIKTKKSSCKILKPVVLCRPLKSSAAGEKAFCNTKVTKKGKIRVKTRGYDKVKVTVIVRAKPKKGFKDTWKPNTWRKSWILR